MCIHHYQLEFAQIIVGNMKNFTYLVGDNETKNGFIIDPSYDIDKVISASRKMDLNIKYIFNTHSHWDHTVGNKEAAQRTGAKICAYKNAPTTKDVSLNDKDIIKIDSLTIKVIHTPGHTPDSVCYLMKDKNEVKKRFLFTGDTLFVGGCGRTDLPGGKESDLYSSFKKILKLDDHVKICPGHDYGSRLISSVRYEKRHNVFLQFENKQEFVTLMKTANR